MDLRERIERQRFDLYPQERHFWSFNDYAAVLSAMLYLRPKRVLEFGPGSSTLALIEGGAELIHSCEDDPSWSKVYRDRLASKFPLVTIVDYQQADPLVIPALEKEHYDMALIDGPRNSEGRVPAIEFALAHAGAVLITVDRSRTIREKLEQLATAKRSPWQVDIQETGPLAGSFALVVKKAVRAKVDRDNQERERAATAIHVPAAPKE